MTGLPRSHDNTRNQDDWVSVLLLAFDHVSTDLRSGKPFGPRALEDMLKVQRRAEAFVNNLNERLPIVEDE